MAMVVNSGHVVLSECHSLNKKSCLNLRGVCGKFRHDVAPSCTTLHYLTPYEVNDTIFLHGCLPRSSLVAQRIWSKVC